MPPLTDTLEYTIAIPAIVLPCFSYDDMDVYAYTAEFESGEQVSVILPDTKI